jgi:hypothetical protein
MMRSGIVFAVLAGTIATTSPSGAFHDTTPAQHQTQQSNPIKLGVSGSSQEHVISGAFAYCYAGTLGALVNTSSGVAVLSNNHVLAKENNPDDTRLSIDGNVIIHQALLDRASCPINGPYGENDKVAVGVSYVPLKFCKSRTNCPETNVVDAAIAPVIVPNPLNPAGRFAANGEILGVGTLFPTVVSPEAAPPRLVVQKSGRTTGHTKGTVEDILVTVRVSYDSGIALFVNQMRIRGCGMNFSAGGDSGSLIVTSPSVTSPSVGSAQPVGLLFAGGGADTFANPAGAVLSAGAWVGNGGAKPLSFVGGGTTAGTLVAGAADTTCNATTSTGGGKKPRSAGNPRSVEQVAAIKERNSSRLLALPEVQGHGVGFDEDGQPQITLYLRGRPTTAMPTAVEGVPIRIIVTGPIRAY